MKFKIFTLIVLFSSVFSSGIFAQWQLAGETKIGNQFASAINPNYPLKSPQKEKFYILDGAGGSLGNFSVFDAESNSITYATNNLNTSTADIDSNSGFMYGLLNNTEISVIDLNNYSILNKYIRDYFPDYYIVKLHFIEKKNFLIIQYITYGLNQSSKFLIKSMPDFVTQAEFDVDGVGYDMHVLNEDSLKIYFTPRNSNSGKVFNIETLQFENDFNMPNYPSLKPIYDAVHNRLILMGYDGHIRDIVLISLNDFSQSIVNAGWYFLDAVVDIYNNKLYATSFSDGLYIINLETMVREVHISPEVSGNGYYVFPFFSIPYNKLYVFEGQYIIIFDLETYEFLGKIKVGVSLNNVIVDDNLNRIFLNEIDNGDITSLTDYNPDQAPVIKGKLDVPNYNNRFENDYFIDKSNKKIYLAGSGNFVNIFDYDNNKFDKINTIKIASGIVKDLTTNDVFVGTADYYAQNTIFRINSENNFVASYNTPGLNMRLELDNDGFLYSLLHYVQPGFTLGKEIIKINTASGSVVNSLKFGFNLTAMEYSAYKNCLYILNGVTDEFPSKIYKIDCSSFTISDSINIEGFVTDNIYLNTTLHEIFIQNSAQGSSGTMKLTVIDEETFSIKNEQFLPDVINASSISFNEYTNSLYVTDVRRGVLLKYNNVNYPSVSLPPVPAAPQVLVGDNKASLQWDVNSNLFNKFNIYRKTVESSWIRINSNPVTQGVYIDYNLENNQRYFYSLTQLNDVYVESKKSDSVEIIPLDLPDFNVSLINYSNIIKNNGGSGYFNFSIIRDNTFDENIDFTLFNLPAGIISETNFNGENNAQVDFSVNLTSDGSLESGIYNFDMILESNSQTHFFPMQIKIVENIEITFEIVNEDIFLGDIINLTGNVSDELDELNIFVINSSEEIIFQNVVSVDEYKTFSYGLSLFTADSFYVYFESVDGFNASDKKLIYVERAKTFISCKTNISQPSNQGWILDITGKIVPNPGEVKIDLKLISPDSSISSVNSIPVNEFGYYGHSILVDDSGIWELYSTFSGNDNYEPSVSNPLLIPVGVKYGKVVLFATDNQSFPESIFKDISSFAYLSLLDRQISKEDIIYLYNQKDIDVDENGLFDDIDSLNTFSNLKNVILNNSNDSITTGMDFLLYLSFSSNDAEFNAFDNLNIPIDSLASWLHELNLKNLFRNINIIVESEYGNVYIDKLSADGVNVIASSKDSTNLAATHANLTFSYPFWTHIRSGYSLGESFTKVYDLFNAFGSLLNDQLPQIDFDGDLIPNEQEDFDSANQLFVGFSSVVDNFPPNILGGSVGALGQINYVSNSQLFHFDKKQITANNIYLNVFINDPENNISNVSVYLKNSEGLFEKREMNKTQQNNIYQFNVGEMYNLGLNNYLISALDHYKMISNYKFVQMFITDSLTSVENNEIPVDFSLSQNYPNPFNPNTTIQFDLPINSFVVLEIFNILGEKVLTSLNNEITAGHHKININMGNLSSGVYIYRITADKFRDVKKMLLIK